MRQRRTNLAVPDYVKNSEGQAVVRRKAAWLRMLRPDWEGH